MTRSLMLSDIYRRIFPETILDKKAVDYVRTTQQGARYVTSVGSDITGFGADVIILDDPMQPDDAASEKAKERLRSWVFNSVLTRFNDTAKGALILVMHRLAPDDLSATLEPNADFVLKLPLIAEKEEKYARHGKLTMYRKPGDVLNPAAMTKEKAAKLKADFPDHVWNGQYQQRPTAGGSGMLSIERFQRFDLSKPPKFELSIHSWDVGATIGGNASVCTKWGLAPNKDKKDALHLTQVISLRLELPEVLAAIKAEIEKDRPALIIIDERGVGLGIVQHLKRAGYRNISWSSATKEPVEIGSASRSRPSDSKIERFGRAILRIEDGQVLIPMSAPFLEKFLYETSAFPNISDDDQVDSMTQVIANFGTAIAHARRNKRLHG
jgi:predicted phage terminase large subunit-like protein